MSLVRTFLANSGVLSMGPSQDSDRSLSKNIGAAVDGTGKPIQNVKMSDYYESVVDSDNVTQVIDGGNPVAMSDFRNKTGRLTQESVNTTIDNRNSTIVNKYVSPSYQYRTTCKVSKNACVTGTNRRTKYGVSYVTRFNTTFRNTTQTTVTVEKDLQPVKEIIRAFFQSLFS